jgi:hypothetical protein
MVQASTTSGTNPAVGTTAQITTAACPAGTKLVGGGAQATSSSGTLAQFATLEVSRPTGGTPPTQWQATARAATTFTGGSTFTVTAYALCAG